MCARHCSKPGHTAEERNKNKKNHISAFMELTNFGENMQYLRKIEEKDGIREKLRAREKRQYRERE